MMDSKTRVTPKQPRRQSTPSRRLSSVWLLSLSLLGAVGNARSAAVATSQGGSSTATAIPGFGSGCLVSRSGKGDGGNHGDTDNDSDSASDNSSASGGGGNSGSDGDNGNHSSTNSGLQPCITPGSGPFPISLPSASTPTQGSVVQIHNGLSHGAIAGIAIGSVLGVLILLLVALFLIRRRWKRRQDKFDFDNRLVQGQGQQQQGQGSGNLKAGERWTGGPMIATVMRDNATRPASFAATSITGTSLSATGITSMSNVLSSRSFSLASTTTSYPVEKTPDYLNLPSLSGLTSSPRTTGTTDLETSSESRSHSSTLGLYTLSTSHAIQPSEFSSKGVSFASTQQTRDPSMPTSGSSSHSFDELPPAYRGVEEED